jgi:hypothetical protein
MTISKFTTNLYASEVYRELERNAVKKGHFKPTEEETIKLASEQISIDKEINKPIDTDVSGDLVQDVSKLAYALRRKGFIAQAEEIESKLVSYAQAEKSLYDVKIEKCKNDYDKEVSFFPGNELGVIETPETAAKKILEVVEKEPTVKTAGYPYGVTSESMNDIINFAHRDGDADLVGFGDQGVFETIHSIADKILEVAHKQPTGKHSIAELALEITKTAQESPNTYKTMSGHISANLVKLSEMMSATFYFGSDILNKENGSGNFLANNPSLASLFGTLGGNYKELYDYGTYYNKVFNSKLAFKIQPPANINEIATSITKSLNDFISNLKKQNEQLDGWTQHYLINILGIKGTNDINNITNEIIFTASQNVANTLLTMFRKAAEELDKAQNSLVEKQNNAKEAAKILYNIASINKDTMTNLYSFTSAVLSAEIDKKIWWTNRIYIGFGKENESNYIMEIIGNIKRSVEELNSYILKVNPEVTVSKDVLSKLTNLESKISGKKDSKFNEILVIVKKLIQIVKANDKDTLKEMGYNSVSDIVPDIIDIENKLS